MRIKKINLKGVIGMKWQKLIIYMGISLFLISCGKKKEATREEAPAPAPAAPAETKPTEQNPAPVTPVDLNKKEANKEGRGALNGQRKETKGKGSSGKTVKKESKSSNSSSPTVKETKPAAGSSSSSSSSSKAVAGSVPLTGGVSTYGLLYTGASQDAVLERLISLEAGKSAEQVKMNKALAVSIFETAYLVDRTGQLTIDVTLKSNGRIEDHRFQMPFEAQTQMSLDNSGIKVLAECIDAQPYSDDCSNLLVTIQKGSAEAKAVLRQTKADLWFQYDISKDEEFNQLANFLRNSKLDYVTDDRVDKIYLNTYEIVGGKSGYVTAIMGKAKQVIALKSDLLINSDLSAPLNMVDKVTDWNDINMFMAASGKDLKFMSMIKSAKLIQNSGKGQITLEVTTESKSSKALNKVFFKITRKDVATRF